MYFGSYDHIVYAVGGDSAVDVPKINDFPVIESAVTVIVIALVALIVTVVLRRKN